MSTPSTTNTNAPRSETISTETRRQMEFMPWISRSSGLEKSGDSLKDHKIQEEYRVFLEDKVKKVMNLRVDIHRETPNQKKHRLEEQENLLILFRKLREGISSSARIDAFTMEVYETSLYLSVIFASHHHTTIIIPTLLNDLYPKVINDKLSSSQSATETQHRHSSISHIISLLHLLISKYPSQNFYHQQSPSNKHVSQSTLIWFQKLTLNLRRGNYHQIGLLTRHECISRLLDDEGWKPNSLGGRAVMISIDTLREKARESMWNVIRSAYRELWSADRQWFCRCLCLDEGDSSFDEWLLGLKTSSQIIPKEGSENRWIVMKR
ncbi:hypothetical protein AGABI1DRAFT_128401 [Agaricus bisporus var. burnettii JB137-S8]|uniref:Uncharacterized protein n=1 Tax=Agaricus bisporus var. burnettii (strain JB137-S8 / ATCC MYA-4627 / FGSC 10392) TaxID=597362 RepID=K5X8C4_AGABU|nr:uncharacterized protein AGABI1DRAFT_128401 [Agaricus bisporus var. burnettii JB137-S8]EKM79242.1 hypothetical protein AGABI1DRAFT_128401 [Agaricus bisporus var. burnettii JB137-S8]